MDLPQFALEPGESREGSCSHPDMLVMASKNGGWTGCTFDENGIVECVHTDRSWRKLLRTVLDEYIGYFNRCRPLQGLEQRVPTSPVTYTCPEPPKLVGGPSSAGSIMTIAGRREWWMN